MEARLGSASTLLWGIENLADERQPASQGEGAEWFGAVYTLRYAGAVYLLHAFHKKSKTGRETPRRDMELIEQHLRDAEQIAKGRARDTPWGWLCESETRSENVVVIVAQGGAEQVKFRPRTSRLFRLERSRRFYLSGKRPGIQRDASVAGNIRRRGARALLDVRTPRSISAETIRRA